jgi:hypothetical protein
VSKLLRVPGGGPLRIASVLLSDFPFPKRPGLTIIPKAVFHLSHSVADHHMPTSYFFSQSDGDGLNVKPSGGPLNLKRGSLQIGWLTMYPTCQRSEIRSSTFPQSGPWPAASISIPGVCQPMTLQTDFGT